MMAHKRQLRLRLGQRRAGPEAGENSHRMRATIVQILCRVLANRSQHIRVLIAGPESRGRDTHKRVNLVVEDDLCSDHALIAFEVALPKSVAQDRHRCAAGTVLFRQERASSEHRNTEHGKKFSRDLAQVNILRFSRRAQRRPIEKHSPHLERTALALAIEKVRVSNVLFTVHRRVPGIRMAVHRNQPVGLWIRQRLQQNAIDHGEHHGRGSGAEGQRQQRNRRESRIFAQRAQRVAQVLPQVFDPPRAARIAALLFHLLRTA